MADPEAGSRFWMPKHGIFSAVAMDSAMAASRHEACSLFVSSLAQLKDRIWRAEAPRRCGNWVLPLFSKPVTYRLKGNRRNGRLCPSLTVFWVIICLAVHHVIALPNLDTHWTPNAGMLMAAMWLFTRLKHTHGAAWLLWYEARRDLKCLLIILTA